MRDWNRAVARGSRLPKAVPEIDANPVTFLRGRSSGAGTNLKVGDTGPEQKWGEPVRRQAPEKNFC